MKTFSRIICVSFFLTLAFVATARQPVCSELHEQPPLDQFHYGSDIDRQPTFQGGDLNNFRTWVARHMIYPQSAMHDAIEGRVIIKFIVEKDGSISDIEVLRSPDDSLTAEVIRLMNECPAWEPGIHRGEPARVSFVFPVDFKRN